MQAAKQQVEDAAAEFRAQLEQRTAQLQEAQRAAGDQRTVAELRAFAATAASERESLKRSLLASAKVRARPARVQRVA